MHAMLLLANAAGLAFVPHLRQLLDLAQGMLLSGAAWLGASGEAGRAWAMQVPSPLLRSQCVAL